VGQTPLLPFCCQLQSILVAMAPWIGAQLAFAVKAFYKNSDSFVVAQHEFRREFGIRRNSAVPSAHAIKTWVRSFKAISSTLKKKGGSVKTVNTPENIAVVREIIERSPHCSAHRHSVSLRPSEASVRQILHKDLHFYPYKIQITHVLCERDYVNRVNFCQMFLQSINQNQELVNNLLMSDESHFHLCRFVNKQNFHYWSATNPIELYERPLHSSRVTVCARYLHLELSVLTALKMREKGL
jgi:hypothetical protein